MQIIFGKENIPIEICFQNRKTVSIQIKEKGHVLVKAPFGIKKTVLEEIIKKKEPWIIKNRDYIIKEEKKKGKIEEGADLYYRGETYKLHLAHGKEKKAALDPIGHTILLTFQPEKEEEAKKILLSWYRKEAERIILERLAYYEAFFIKKPKKVLVKEQKKRWGTCTGDNKLYFNWRIVMVPPALLDYIVVHELCHMEEKNHGKAFWDSVERILPDYRERRNQLRKEGIHYDLE